MAEIIRARVAIPEIGAEMGDHIIVRRGHPDAPLAVVKRYGRRNLEALERSGVLEGPSPAPAGRRTALRVLP